jgi:hypothetical protein
LKAHLIPLLEAYLIPLLEALLIKMPLLPHSFLKAGSGCMAVRSWLVVVEASSILVVLLATPAVVTAVDRLPQPLPLAVAQAAYLEAAPRA